MLIHTDVYSKGQLDPLTVFSRYSGDATNSIAAVLEWPLPGKISDGLSTAIWLKGWSEKVTDINSVDLTA